MADPTSGLLPPPMDSSGYGDYLDMQRKQALASMLMQNTQRSLQTPANWDSMKVVPRKSLLSSLAGLGSAYAGGKAQQNANQASMKYMGGLFGDTPQQPPQTPQASAQPAPDMPPESIRAPGYQPPAQAPTPGNPTLQNSMIPPGMSRGMASRLWMTLGPQGYAEKVLVPSQMGTPEWQTLLRATRGNTDQAAQLLLMKNQKGTLTDVRPAGTLADSTGNPIFTAPSNGVQITWQNGQPQASPVPGAAGAAAGMAAATDAAKTANTLGTLPTAGGGSKVGYLGDLLGAPPGNRPVPAMGLPGMAPLHAQMPPQAAQPAAAPNASPQPKPYFQAPQSGKDADPFPNAPRVQTSGSLGAPDATTAVVQKARGEKQVELQTKYGSDADLANQQISRIQEALEHVKGANFGPWSDEITNMQGILHEVAPTVFDGGAATDTQIFKKNAVNLALQGAKGIYGPRMTSSEVMLQKNEASPSEQQTKEAATALLKQQQILSEYNRQRAKDYDTYIDHGHDPLRFESWYSNVQNPLQNYALQHDPERQVQLAKDRGLNIPQTAFERLRDKPELKAAFQQKYGFKPDGF
jgi:hypothetical protein